MTEAERNLVYAEAQVSHPDPQFRPLLVWIYGPRLPEQQVAVERERDRKMKEDRTE